MTPYIVFLAFSLVSIVTTAAKRHKIHISGRIVNGYPVDQKTFPFMVSLSAYNSRQRRWMHKCGGSIVNQVTVLTACHCVAVDNMIFNDGEIYFHDFRRLLVIAGTSDWWRGSPTMQTSPVSRTIPHPLCFKGKHGIIMNDLAIVELMHPLVFNENVQPMKVFHGVSAAKAEMDRIIRQGEKCFTPGWGVTHEKGEVSRQLMVAPTQLLHARKCRRTFCSISGIHCDDDFDSMGHVCVINPRANPCFGDSGGPLVCNGFVFGTTSYGARCLPGYPAVYQNVAAILDTLDRFSLLAHFA